MEAIKDSLIAKATALTSKKPTLVSYIKDKMDLWDLHGAIDGLMDLRDIDIEIKQIEEFIEMLKKQ